MLKIWGRLTSVNVQKVVWCADELAIEYQRVDAGGKFGLVDTPDYLAMNPNGLIPVINDDGFVMWESNAIVRYLSARHGSGSLSPADPQRRADADRWMDWQATAFNPAIGPAFWHLIRFPAEQRDAAVIEAARDRRRKNWRCSMRTWRTTRLLPALSSPWVTFPSAVRWIAGTSCRWRVKCIRMWSGGMRG